MLWMINKFITGVFCCLAGTMCSGPALPEDRPPNILLIMADDIGIEGFGCYGGTSYETPNIDRLANEGLRFTHAYSQPLCTPTRIQLMTGRYNHRNWLYFGVLDPSERTFGHLMAEAGYRTCIAGKWQLTSYDPPHYPGSEQRRDKGMHPGDAGFEGYSLFHAGHTEDKGSRYGDPTFLRDGVLFKDVNGAYGEDFSVEYICDFMEKHRDEPFFVYYPMALPHGPFVPTPISEDWNNPETRLKSGINHYPDMVKYMDLLVGVLVDKLGALKLLEETLVLFYSDNGSHKRIVSMMEKVPITGGKGETTQTGIRVPMVAYWPGTITPGISSNLIDASDFLPTLAELGRVDIPADWQTDGISFAPILLGEEGKSREHAFFWYDPRPGWDKDQFSREIFALDHHYKYFLDGRMFDIEGMLPTETLLDTNNLDPEAEKARKELREIINSMMVPPLSGAALEDPVNARQ